MNNKKLLVFSDTHGHLSPLKAVFNWAKDCIPPNGSICCTAFLGDGLSDLRMAADAAGFYSEWKLIRGNNDYDSNMPETALLDYGDHRFFMCHGHRHNLHGDYRTLITAGRTAGADVVLFGHSHVPFQKTVNGTLLVNPGSVGRPRSRIGATFAVIECATGCPPTAEFYGIGSRGEIKAVKV